jgi:hypothetical protein
VPIQTPEQFFSHALLNFYSEENRKKRLRFESSVSGGICGILINGVGMLME